MKKKYFFNIIICLLLIVGVFYLIKYIYFKNEDINLPIQNIVNYIKKEESDVLEPTTKVVENKNVYRSTDVISFDEEEPTDIVEVLESEYPYSIPPEIIDDGSIIYDGMTITELTNQLNKSLSSYMTNTGYFFADYTRKTGINPYQSVAIVLLETGCKWGCSRLTVECNNIGGLKGHGSCNGTSYSVYPTLDEGISSYLDIIYYNYYLKGKVTPEEMNTTYAASPKWAEKVNAYIKEIKEK